MNTAMLLLTSITDLFNHLQVLPQVCLQEVGVRLGGDGVLMHKYFSRLGKVYFVLIDVKIID